MWLTTTILCHVTMITVMAMALNTKDWLKLLWIDVSPADGSSSTKSSATTVTTNGDGDSKSSSASNCIVAFTVLFSDHLNSSVHCFLCLSRLHPRQDTIIQLIICNEDTGRNSMLVSSALMYLMCGCLWDRDIHNCGLHYSSCIMFESSYVWVFCQEVVLRYSLNKCSMS